MHVLVVSPIPSHPQDQGNSQRIFRLCRMLQLVGVKVHFLYYTLEGLETEQRRQMEACWDGFTAVMPRPLPRGPTLQTHYGIDDWYDPAVGEMAARLHTRWGFAAVIVNYVWCSAALEALPGDLVKIVDAHDVFGDRHLRSLAAGMKAEWFYTSPAEERRGLARADIVLAIQDEEKSYFEELGLPRVKTVGFVVPPHFLPPRRAPGARPVIGYIASSNPWNVHAFNALHALLESRPALTERLAFHLAGPICRVVAANNRIFKSLGRVDSVGGFYRDVDAVINPMVGGTGLKIKSIEALSFGRALFATVDGMVGIASDHADHQAPSIEALLDRLAGFSAETIAPRAAASRATFLQYQHQQMKAFLSLLAGAGLDRPARHRDDASAAAM